MKDKIILVGSGGSGKDYAKKLLIEYGYKTDVSYTTRPPRNGETGGVDYHFRTENQMLKMMCDNEFVQVCYFPNGYVYGTHREEFENNNLFIMTPNGLDKLNLNDRQRCFVIYFNIDEMIRLERLKSRGNADDPYKRVRTDKEQFDDFHDFDIAINNPNFTMDMIEELLPNSIISLKSYQG